MSHILTLFFFFNDTATTEIYTLSLHDALPILVMILLGAISLRAAYEAVDWPILVMLGALIPVSEAIRTTGGADLMAGWLDRKSTRLNSSHANISYAVFCLKKKKKTLQKMQHSN